MKPIAELLSDPTRLWRRSPPASDVEISWFLNQTRFSWPEELIDLLRFSNGGEGELALPPEWFALNGVREIINCEKDEFLRTSYENYQFFGGNGGLESIGFDLSKDTSPVVMIDLIA